MISITKNNKASLAVEYKLEVFKDNNLIYTTSVEIKKEGFTDELCDTLAKLQIMKTLLYKGQIEILEELGNLIPVYEEDK